MAEILNPPPEVLYFMRFAKRGGIKPPVCTCTKNCKVDKFYPPQRPRTELVLGSKSPPNEFMR